MNRDVFWVYVVLDCIEVLVKDQLIYCHLLGFTTSVPSPATSLPVDDVVLAVASLENEVDEPFELNVLDSFDMAFDQDQSDFIYTLQLDYVGVIQAKYQQAYAEPWMN